MFRFDPRSELNLTQIRPGFFSIYKPEGVESICQTLWASIYFPIFYQISLNLQFWGKVVRLLQHLANSNFCDSCRDCTISLHYTAVFFHLFTILKSCYSSQPIAIVYFPSQPMASLGESRKIKKYHSICWYTY